MPANMAFQRTRHPSLRSGRSLRSLGSPLNAYPLCGGSRLVPVAALAIVFLGCTSIQPVPEVSGCPEPAGNWSDAETRRISECWIWHDRMVLDACLRLGRVGTLESVSSLIYALKLYPPASGERGVAGMIDTTEHCAESLRQITKQDLGYGPEAWEAWWVAGDHPSVPAPPPKRSLPAS